jgi:hypothetical protein
MATKLSKTGTVTITDLKDSWELVLEAGRTYSYEAKNTGSNGKFSFVVQNESLNYGDVPITEQWFNVVKVTVNPGKTKTGTFKAAQSIHGLNSSDADTQARIASISYIRVSVNWVVTVYKSKYSVKVTD